MTKKIIITVTNNTNALESKIFEGSIIKEISVDSYFDHDVIFGQVFDFIKTIDGFYEMTLSYRVTRENGSLILIGVYQNGNSLGGTFIS